MSTAEGIELAPLEAGQRMRRAEFHARYCAMPPEFRAELIGGEVFVSSPVGAGHGYVHSLAMGWLMGYAARTPGVESFDNVSVVLGDEDEVQPDGCLRLSEGRVPPVKSSAIIEAPPGLVVEVAYTSEAIDLGRKLAACERAGVREYVVVAAARGRIAWHALRDGRLAAIGPDPDGLHRSAAFPGLWLDVAALLAGDGAGLLAALGRGLESAEHAGFVATLGEGGRG